MKYFSHRDRPVHMGPYPFERLKRQSHMPELSRVPPMQSLEFADAENAYSFINAMPKFMALITTLRDGVVSPDPAPIPEDPDVRAKNLKSWAFHEGMSAAGVCEIPNEAVLPQPITPGPALKTALEQRAEMAKGASSNRMFAGDEKIKSTMYGQGQVGGDGATPQERDGAGAAAPKGSAPGPGGPGGPGPMGGPPGPLKPYGELGHTHSLVILSELKKNPGHNEPGARYIEGSQFHRAAMYAADVAILIAGYLRTLGFSARAHTMATSDLDLNVLAVVAGVGEVVKTPHGYEVHTPYQGKKYALAAISTNMVAAPDRPLAPRSLADRWASHGPAYLLGTKGTKPGLKIGTGAQRPLHMGPYPMEKIKRRKEPTTLIDEPNVPRIPKRHDMFIRASHGDLGDKVQQAMAGLKLMLKEPYNHTTMRVIGGCVPLQYGEPANAKAPDTDDPEANAKDIKALGYYIGADLVGICEAKSYAWYSHDHDGSEIVPYHKYAIVIASDQGYETMEGASGDDWITGSQGTKGYRRGSLFAGMLAEHIRRLGHSARTHTVVDQDVLHIPLALWSGIGELSRIGELVLNPFMGPRFKTTVITTDMPLAVDQPVDFGLQHFCSNCRKCARECPVGCIPFGNKIMFNAYESWKQDAEKCAKYRITNPGGTGCGRCMKTCPWNTEGVLKEKPFLWAAINIPWVRRYIPRLDDWVGNGKQNPVKKWWYEVAWLDGKVVTPKRTNAHDLNFSREMDATKQRTAVFPKELNPPADAKGPVPIVDIREQARDIYKNAERPEDYRRRIKEEAKR